MEEECMTQDCGTPLEAAADIIAGSSCLLAFTGAGVSADSGLPTFRGEGGLWGRYDERHLEIDHFREHPAECWETIRAIFYGTGAGFQPNDAHRVLAGWERDGILDFLVTQNIDGLHGQAGSRAVAEFHGSCSTLRCMRCGTAVEATAARIAASPPCCACGGVFKPGFTFFGEAIPERAREESFAAAGRADACIVIGSTGTVQPAASVPRLVKSHGGAVVEVNPEPSEFTRSITDVFLPMGAAEALRRLDSLVRRRLGK